MYKIIDYIKKNYGELPRSIYILFISRVVNRIGGFVVAFLAIFMKKYLSWDVKQISEYIALSGVLVMVAPFIGGSIADKRGRKNIYVIATIIGAFCYIFAGYYCLDKPKLIPVFLIIATFCHSMVSPISSAMVADICEDDIQRKRAYALIYLGINVGTAIGPMLGGFLLANHVALFFYGDAITTLISITLVILFVKETKLDKAKMKEVKGHEKLEEGHIFDVLIKRPILLLFVLFAMLNSFIYSQCSFALPLQITNFFGDAQGSKFYGFMMSLNAVIVVAFTMFLTELLKHKRAINNIVKAMFLTTLGFFLLAFSKDYVFMYVISTIIWTFGEIIMTTNNNIFIMSMTPVNFRGRFNAVIGFVMGTGIFLSPKIMSIIIDRYSFAVSWYVIGFIGTIAFFGMIYISYLEKKMMKADLDNDIKIKEL